MSPAGTLRPIITPFVPFSMTHTVPVFITSNLQGCEPYSLAFCAMSPTFRHAPIVFGSKAPFTSLDSTTSSKTTAWPLSGMLAKESGQGVLLLVVRVPPPATAPDGGGPRVANDDVAGHVQVRGGTRGVDLRHGAAHRVGRQDVLLDGRPLGIAQVGNLHELVA